MRDDEKNDEFDRAYREFLRQRWTDANAEERATLDQNVDVALIVRILRRLGNTPLADQYEAAFADMQRTLLLDGARYSTDDAAEHFRRVQAEAFAWLHRRVDDDNT